MNFELRTSNFSALLPGFLSRKTRKSIYPPSARLPYVIPERFWPESRNTPEWIPAKGMPE
jgi:hypothetical protein